MRHLWLFLITICISSFTFAARVDTVSTYSPSMKKNIKAVVVLPDSYQPANKRYPVIYLLHGYSGDYSNYIKNVPKIKNYSDSLSIIFVCPDGNYGSWYFDSPIDSTWKYETYVASELVHWVDEHYATQKDRKGRAITGLSMGGHGALYLAFRHQDTFGAAGSMSGGVDIRPFPLKWEIARRLGDYATHRHNWDENTVINMIYLLKPDSLKIIFDCGTEDFFSTVNNRLHEKLLERNIPHDFISRPGGHTWDYWRNAIQYQILFFQNFFKEG